MNRTVILMNISYMYNGFIKFGSNIGNQAACMSWKIVGEIGINKRVGSGVGRIVLLS